MIEENAAGQYYVIINDRDMSSNNSSSATASTSSSDFIISMIQYSSFGAVAVITNLIIFFVLFRNIQYLKKSAFIAGLALGDLLDGISLTVLGLLRIVQTLNGTWQQTVHPTYCMKILITPIFLMGNQIPGIMFFLVGVERFLAVVWYEWYYSKWSNKIAWILTIGAYLYCIFSVIAGFIVTFSYNNSTRISIICGTSTVVGSTYSAYNYSVGIIGGTVAVVATLIAMVVFTKRKNKMFATGQFLTSTNAQIHLKKQWQLTRITLCLAVVDFGFLVVPSFLITLSSGFNVDVGNIKAWALQLVCFRSILNVIIYLVINSDFRTAALRAIRIKKFDGGQLFFTKNFTGPHFKITPF